MRISRGAGDTVRLRLSGPEAQTLSSLLADLINALQPGALDRADPVYRRLYPDGYQQDPGAAEAFRSLTESSLQEERLGRAQQCLTTLTSDGPASAGLGKRKIDATLDAEAVQCWLRVTNDLRLAIGTRIGITEQDEQSDFDPADEQSMQHAIYAYLTGLQDTLVRACMG